MTGNDPISPELEESFDKHRQDVDRISGTLVPSPREAYVGDTITLKGRNFPPDRAFDLVWNSVDGSWGVIEDKELVGPQFKPRSERIMQVRTDGSGAFDTEWTVPEDYGGSHTIEVRTDDGGTVTEADLDICPRFELENTTAPLGGWFTLKGYGIGTGKLRSNYQVAWDNAVTGFVTGVLNRGTATAKIRAAGPPGRHLVRVWRGHRGVPFLQANTQSPYPPVAGGRQSKWTVEVTEPETQPRTAWLDDQLDETPLSSHYPDVGADTDARLDITPTSGPAGTSATLRGETFPPNTEVDLIWHRHDGHRVEGIPITPEPRPDVLPTVTTGADGTFAIDVEVPRDVGSTRPITARIDGREVAVTGFVLQPWIENFEPTSGPVGTEITIELGGVGWTEYDNGPFLVYDNKPLGYFCGVDDDDGDRYGISRTVVEATGEPGWHFIDIYPSLFQIQEVEPDFELIPHLSYVDNHPVRPLPAWHFAFEVTE
jgi:hypothetical protein